jgi:BMFP domain-containing protein YqiC
MAGPSPLMDGFARLVTDATGVAQGVRREIETTVKSQLERLVRDMDVATREEVEVLRDSVAALRAETEALRAKVEVLEARSVPGTANDVGSMPG